MNGIPATGRAPRSRLVTNPDRMVVKEAMRTFTYSLYGYLTDAVVVNRLLPADGFAFAAWREVQEEQLALARSAFDPVPVLTAAYYEREVMEREMLDRLGSEVFDGRDAGGDPPRRADPGARDGQQPTTLRLAVPFAERDDLSLKIGLEVIVRANCAQAHDLLPPALAGYATSGARASRTARSRSCSRGHRWRVSATSKISSPRSSASSCSRCAR